MRMFKNAVSNFKRSQNTPPSTIFLLSPALKDVKKTHYQLIIQKT